MFEGRWSHLSSCVVTGKSWWAGTSVRGDASCWVHVRSAEIWLTHRYRCVLLWVDLHIFWMCCSSAVMWRRWSEFVTTSCPWEVLPLMWWVKMCCSVCMCLKQPVCSSGEGMGIGTSYPLCDRTENSSHFQSLFDGSNVLTRNCIQTRKEVFLQLTFPFPF